MYVLAWGTVYALTRGLFWCLFPKLRSNEGNKHQNNTKIRLPYVLLMKSQSIGDDITMTRQLWREHVISNSLDIDFIHNDIHDANKWYLTH